MSTKTTTAVTHYHVQKKRRAEFIEQWRKHRLAALAQRLEVSKNPALLTFDDLREAARKRGGVEWVGAAAPSSKELFPDVPKHLMHDHHH